MMRLTPLLLAFALTMGGIGAQIPGPADQFPRAERPPRLPDGRDRNEAMLKADHEATMKDLATMRTLLRTVRTDLEKNDRHVLSVQALKNLEEIEKLSKRVRNRMNRH